MHQRRDARCRRGLGDGLCALRLDPLEITRQHADQIHHHVRAAHRMRDRLGLGDVGADELRLAEPAERLEEERLSRIALRDADARTRRQQRLRDIAADEPAAPDQRHQLVVHCRPVQFFACRFAQSPFASARGLLTSIATLP